MQLNKLKHYISLYKSFLEKTTEYDEEYKWESLRNFQNNWDIDAPDFAEMYDQSLQNSVSKRMWTGQNFYPKEMMLKLIKLDTEFVRRMFKDLFNEDKDIEGRVSRFTFGLDELLKDYKKANRTSIENNHFHDHNHIISMYLTFHYPEKYSIFYYSEFRDMMEQLGSVNIPGPYEIDRFFKISRTFYKFLSEDLEIQALQHLKLNPLRHYMGPSLLLSHDFYYTCTQDRLIKKAR